LSKFLILLVFTAIGLIEIPGLVRQRYWKELAAFLFLLGIGLVLIILIWLGVKIPFLIRN
jgi:apolipoprotein N-acyltransferase